MKPTSDHDYLTWPMWDDKVIRLPEIKKLKMCGVNVVADLLNMGNSIQRNNRTNKKHKPKLFGIHGYKAKFNQFY